MKRRRIEGIYAILDPEAAAGKDLFGLAQAVLAAGVKVIQLRAKKMSTAEMYEAARALAGLCDRYSALFILNDRLDVALAAEADGVHLGQEDLPLSAARRIAPENFIIGISTHSLKEARAAEAGGADYIGFGALYATQTKKDVTAPQGPERLRETARAVKIPVVAIAGITAERIPQVKSAGAAAAAVISTLCGAADPQAAAEELVRAWQES